MKTKFILFTLVPLILWRKSTFSHVEMDLSCKPNDSKHHEGFVMFQSNADPFNIFDATGNFQS